MTTHPTTPLHSTAHLPVRLTPGTLIDITDLLQAERFELIGDDVTFEAQRGAETLRWHGRLGDQLVADGRGYWRIVGSEPWNPLELWSEIGLPGATSAAEPGPAL